MGLLLGTRRALMGAIPTTYADKVLGYSPILYYPMNETAGAVAVNYGTLGTGANGAYTGVTLANAAGPAGEGMAPFFDGANDYLNAFTAALAAAFTASTTGTIVQWCRVFNAGVWTDGAARGASRWYADAPNLIGMTKDSANNQWFFDYRANGLTEREIVNPYNNTAWYHAAITWNQTTNWIYGYLDGVLQGGGEAIANNWMGGALTAAVIGAFSTVPGQVWHGWIAHTAVFTTDLTQPQIADLANPVP